MKRETLMRAIGGIEANVELSQQASERITTTLTEINAPDFNLNRINDCLARIKEILKELEEDTK